MKASLDQTTIAAAQLWTLCGVGIGVLVMFLAGLLARRAAKTPPQTATQPA